MLGAALRAAISHNDPDQPHLGPPSQTWPWVRSPIYPQLWPCAPSLSCVVEILLCNPPSGPAFYQDRGLVL